MELPFRHIVAVLHNIESTIDVTLAFHPSYLVKNFKKGFEERTTEVVVSTKKPCINYIPTPYYKHAGRRQKVVLVDQGIQNWSCVQVPVVRASGAQH